MITIKNVGKKFGKAKILNSCSLSFKEGDRVAIVGGNGAGKTTLLRCLLGHYIYSGRILVFGMDARAQREEVLQKVGFVPQLPPPIQMTIGELINFSIAITNNLTKVDIYNVAKDLHFDIGGNLSKPFSKLSGGMKQKMLIALALAKRPELLVLDEPAANLDPYGRDIFFKRIAKIPKETIIILTSHRIKEVHDLVNRVVEMDSGHVMKQDKMEGGIE